MPRPSRRRSVKAFVPEEAHQRRCNQRDDRYQQASGGAGEARFGVPEEQPRPADLRECEQHDRLPMLQHWRQGTSVQSDRQQQKGADESSPERHHQGVDLLHGHAYQQIRNSPDDAQRQEQNPSTAGHGALRLFYVQAKSATCRRGRPCERATRHSVRQRSTARQNHPASSGQPDTRRIPYPVRHIRQSPL